MVLVLSMVLNNDVLFVGIGIRNVVQWMQFVKLCDVDIILWNAKRRLRRCVVACNSSIMLFGVGRRRTPWSIMDSFEDGCGGCHKKSSMALFFSPAQIRTFPPNTYWIPINVISPARKSTSSCNVRDFPPYLYFSRQKVSSPTNYLFQTTYRRLHRTPCYIASIFSLSVCTS